MDDLLQRALADEVRAELARQGRTAKAAQQAVGVSPTAWQTYFKKQSRDVPMRVLVDVADFLGVPLWQLMQRAEARAGDLAAMHEAEAERGLASLDPDLADRVRRVDRESRDAQEDDKPVAERMTRGGRSAMTG